MANYTPYGVTFNQDALKKIKKLDEEITEETKKGNKDKIVKLRMEQLYQGMMLGSNSSRNNYRAMFPY